MTHFCFVRNFTNKNINKKKSTSKDAAWKLKTNKLSMIYNYVACDFCAIPIWVWYVSFFFFFEEDFFVELNSYVSSTLASSFFQPLGKLMRFIACHSPVTARGASVICTLHVQYNTYTRGFNFWNSQVALISIHEKNPPHFFLFITAIFSLSDTTHTLHNYLYHISSTLHTKGCKSKQIRDMQ